MSNPTDQKTDPSRGRTEQDDDADVHSSATLDFDQLTTSQMDMPALKIPSIPSRTAPPIDDPVQSESSPDNVAEKSSILQEAAAVASDDSAPALQSIVQSIPEDRVTFSNHEVLVPPKAEPAEPETNFDELEEGQPVRNEPTFQEVRPPSLGRFLLIGSIGIVIVLLLWFSYRINWDFDLLRDDPNTAVNLALGVQKAKDPVSPIEAPPPVVRDTLKGELRALDLAKETVKNGPNRGKLLVRGRIQNGTNRLQRMITLQISLEDAAGLAIAGKRISCCALEDSPKAGADDAGPITLKPGDVKYFSVLFPKKLAKKRSLTPTAKIIFSEAERVE